MQSLEPVRGQVRTTDHRRVCHGVYQPVGNDPDPDRERLRDLRAWLLVLPEDAAFTHLTAAWLHGWWLPPLRAWTPVFAAIPLGTRAINRAGLVCSRLDRAIVPEKAGRLPVDTPAEILLRAARDLSLLDLVVMLDSALRSVPGLREAIKDLLASRRPGVRGLRCALDAADERSESAGESVLRMFHRTLGIGVEPQAEIRAGDGTFVCRADLLVSGTTSIHEYDGAVHRRPAQQDRDLKRDRRIGRFGYVRRAYTLGELVHHSTVLAYEMSQDLGRPLWRSRVRTWQSLVADSAYTEAGQRRLANRWWRHNGAPIVA